MRKFGIIGYPVAHSLSPELFRKAYGGRWEYVLIEEPDFNTALSRFLQDDDLCAVNVTAPFKVDAATVAAIKAPEVELCGAANILIKEGEGLKAHNSDFFAVLSLLDSLDGDVAVVGFGGAGRAAFAASQALGKKTRVLHHDELRDPLKEDIIIYTLPGAVEGYSNMECRALLEANYKDPVCRNLPGVDWYMGGELWLKAQAVSGWRLMTGTEPEIQ